MLFGGVESHAIAGVVSVLLEALSSRQGIDLCVVFIEVLLGT